MYVKGDSFASHLMLAISLVFAVSLGWATAVSGSPNSNQARAAVFAIVAVWLALELVLIVLHAIQHGWDGLAASMAIARFSLINYFGAMALNWGALVVVPTWYWLPSRIFIGVAAGAAGAFLIREALWAFHDLTLAGRVLLLATMALLGTVLAILIVTL